jgi:cytochrome c-type biogenesis protein CcmF
MLIGNSCLFFVLLTIFLAFVRPLFLKKAIVIQFAIVSLAFINLIIGFITTDLSLQLVSLHSHPFLPLFYKITATWGNHEGSLLLWLWILSIYNLVFYQLIDPKEEKAAIYIQLFITFGITFYIILGSNPFKINHNTNFAFGLNPILQDIALAIHPPILYMGYVGFAPVFSYGLYLLISSNFKSKNFLLLQQLACFAWSFLTLGIIIGSWWAYRELGWGGFWFWDPVENAALIPWLIGTALIHSNIITRKNNILQSWTLFLSVLVFILCLISSFLVRSGVLSSVHSFASDPTRGIFILIYIVTLILLGIYGFISHFRNFKSSHVKFTFFSIEQTIIFNNLLFVTSAFSILFATIFPLIYNFLYNQSISVGAPYYNITILPLLALSCALAALPTFIKNKKKLLSTIIICFLCSLILYKVKSLSILEITGFSAGLFLVVSMTIEFFIRYKSNRLSSSFKRSFLAHLGIGIMAISISLNSSFSKEFNLTLQEKGQFSFSHYHLKLNKIVFETKKNHFTKKAFFTLYNGLNEISKLTPEIRLYPIEGGQTIESSIYHHIFYDLYLAISDIGEQDKVKLVIYYRPCISWIWFSGILIVYAGLVSCYHYQQKKKEVA